MMEQNNNIFTTPQEELTEEVYNSLIYKPKAEKIKQEINRFIEENLK